MRVFDLMFNFWRRDLNSIKTLGERIRFVRGATPQTTFSETIGINQNTLSRYERNERVPDADFIKLICETTGISSSWLLFGEGPIRSEGYPSIDKVSQTVAPVSTQATICPQCEQLKMELEKERQERREISAENRQLWAKNEQLWAKNEQLLTEFSSIKEENATLRERCGLLEKESFQSKATLKSNTG